MGKFGVASPTLDGLSFLYEESTACICVKAGFCEVSPRARAFTWTWPWCRRCPPALPRTLRGIPCRCARQVSGSLRFLAPPSGELMECGQRWNVGSVLLNHGRMVGRFLRVSLTLRQERWKEHGSFCQIKSVTHRIIEPLPRIDQFFNYARKSRLSSSWT